MRLEADNSLRIVNSDLKRNSLLLILPGCIELSLFKKATAWHSAEQNSIFAHGKQTFDWFPTDYPKFSPYSKVSLASGRFKALQQLSS